MENSTTPSPRFALLRLGLATLCLASPALLAVQSAEAQSLPATQPTSAAQPLPAAALGVATPAEMKPGHARVELRGTQLTIEAQNSSLNGILRQVAQRSGMKITGGVTEQRVFGTYGPAEVGVVLATLLEGTGSNMLVLEDARRLPTELILTPRNGAASPPSPPAERFDQGEGDDDGPRDVGRRFPQRDATPGQTNQSTVPQPTMRPAPRTVPLPAAPELPVLPEASTGSTTPETTTSPGTPTSGTTAGEQSPNGVKTPEQIYEQLLKLQQQKPAAPQ